MDDALHLVTSMNHQRSGNPEAGRSRRGLAIAGLAALACLYLLQLASPLRLVSDGITYLSAAESLAEGRGFHATEHPPGYPALIALLSSIGLGTSWAVIGLNFACLALGLAAAFKICRMTFQLEPKIAGVMTALTLLCWAVLKHALLPLSEMLYFACSMGTVYCLAGLEERKTITGWILAMLLAIAAILVRSAGVALLPAMWWAFRCTRRKHMPSVGLPVLHRSHLQQGLNMGILAAVGGVALMSALKTNYLQVIVHYLYPRGFLQGLLQGLQFKLRELGDLIFNLPFAKAPAAARAAYPLAGTLLLTMIGAGLWRRRRQLRAADIYLGTYLVVLFSWPSYDTRFWVPVLPLLMAWIAVAVRPLMSAWAIRWLVKGYGVVFALIGLVALGYATRISFAGSRFPELYGDGTLRPAYQVALGQATASEMSWENRAALHVLQRYEPRASHVARTADNRSGNEVNR